MTGRINFSAVYCLMLNAHIRARQIRHSKERFAGHGDTIAKDRDAVVADLANSLRVSRETATAALHFLEILSVFRRKRALH